MNLVDPTLRELAEKLLLAEGDTGDGIRDLAAVRVCGKLGVLLTKLAGKAGYHSLLSRAVALARVGSSDLNAVHVLPDGSLAGLSVAIEDMDPAERTRCQVALVAQLLGLLRTFIGTPLTLQLVKEAWPAITSDLSSDNTTP